MNKNANIQAMLETVERIFEATHTVLDDMKEGERIQLKELTQTVSLAVGLEPKRVLEFVNHFAHHTDMAYVSRGKNGGIIRGSRLTKADKTSKKTKKAVAADTSASE